MSCAAWNLVSARVVRGVIVGVDLCRPWAIRWLYQSPNAEVGWSALAAGKRRQCHVCGHAVL